jgi:hypothetical protein
MLKKLLLKPGVNRENTRYTNEGGWYESEKVRFRQGTPEKIGGWERISSNTFLGLCRSLWSWVTLGSQKLLGVGTNIKFYIEQGGAYYDVTPLRTSVTLNNPFATTSGSSTITVTHSGVGAGYIDGDYVSFYGSSAIGGITLLGEYSLSLVSTTSYTVSTDVPVTITSANPAVLTCQNQLANGVEVTLSTTGALPSPFVAGTTYYVVGTAGYTFQLSATSGGAAISTLGSVQSGTHKVAAKATSPSVAAGGGTVQALYQINVGPSDAVPTVGWGAGLWGSGVWGTGGSSTEPLRLWSQQNFGEDLVFGYRGGKIYYWDATIGVLPPSVSITIASPAVLSTWVPCPTPTPIRLLTTGALPTGLSAGTLYYVVNSSGTAFNVASTAGGSPIATSGTQSGTHSISARAEPLSSYGGSSGVPISQNVILVSDINRFLFAMGCTPEGSATFDPMLIRWSDQEDPYNWTPDATNQAGSLRLSRGSEIVAATQSRQEVLVWTDSALYSLQYLGAPDVWGAQIQGDNISIASQNAVAFTNGVSYWMGKDKFYMYDGRTQPLNCDLRRYIFEDINTLQFQQVFAGTNEGFNEVWWFYCSAGSDTIDRYVIYNYLEANAQGGRGVWYYGQMARTAWLDSGVRDYPLAATYANNLVNHEQGLDDNVTGTPAPITASITSAQFDLDDGHQFMFVWRVLPDMTFANSTANSPAATMYLLPMQNSGSGYSVNSATDANHSVANQSYRTITRTATLPIEQFTGQIYTRIRGRQIAMKVESTGLGVTWQLGAPRLDMRPDGKR